MRNQGPYGRWLPQILINNVMVFPSAWRRSSIFSAGRLDIREPVLELDTGRATLGQGCTSAGLPGTRPGWDNVCPLQSIQHYHISLGSPQAASLAPSYVWEHRIVQSLYRVPKKLMQVIQCLQHDAGRWKSLVGFPSHPFPLSGHLSTDFLPSLIQTILVLPQIKAVPK